MKYTKIYYIFIQPVQSQLVGLPKGASVGGMLGCVLLVAGMAAMLIAGQMHLPFLFCLAKKRMRAYLRGNDPLWELDYPGRQPT